jgi:AraC-like DNA-binding protein
MTATKVISDRFKVPSLWATRLREHQVSVPDVLRRAGLPVSFFQQEKIYVTTAELFAFWRAIGETSDDPAIGLKLGTEPRLHYPRHSTVELNEAAFLLGYGDSNSFFRAFHGWEGTTPGEWRTRHRPAKARAVAAG